MDLQPLRALYYPSLHLARLAWVKAVLLYWEGLVWIAPERYARLDPPELPELAADGLIENVDPGPFHDAARDERSALSEVIGRTLHVVPAADRPMSEVASLYQAGHENALASRSLILIDGYALARSLPPFRSLEAAPLSNAALVRTRQKLADERRVFREHVQSRALAIAELPSEDAMRSYMADCAHEIQRAVHAERRGRRASNVRQGWKLVAIAGPASAGVTAVAAGAPGIIGAIGGAGSVGAGVTDWITGRFQRRPTPFHYLLSLERLISHRDSGKL